jgi:hypothetical protein
MKSTSIIGICVAALAFIVCLGYNNPMGYVTAVGWGIIASIYLLAFSIVVLVHANKA